MWFGAKAPHQPSPAEGRLRYCAKMNDLLLEYSLTASLKEISPCQPEWEVDKRIYDLSFCERYS